MKIEISNKICNLVNEKRKLIEEKNLLTESLSDNIYAKILNFSIEWDKVNIHIEPSLYPHKKIDLIHSDEIKYIINYLIDKRLSEIENINREIEKE